jgi:alkane 1-monooxygenase
LRYGIPLLFLGTAPLGFVLGGAWSYLTVALMPVVICGFDYLFGFESEQSVPPGNLAYRLLPWLYIVLQIAVIVWAAMTVARPGVTFSDGLGLTLSVGVTAGVFGFLAAHEMVHSRSAGERALGLTMLAFVGYMHFRIAHIHGHHVRAATFEDPASARRGETAYGFIIRSVSGQFREAWAFEAERLRRRDQPVVGDNRMLAYLLVEIVIAIAAAMLGPWSLAFWVAQAVIAIILLELFNYIAHYGLQRTRLPGGSLERMEDRHSWNSTRRMNNWALFNMGRHSDHHRQPSQAYQRLRIEPDAPELPAGYAGAILLALAPPLWRKVMDPLVDRWMTKVDV